MIKRPKNRNARRSDPRLVFGILTACVVTAFVIGGVATIATLATGVLREIWQEQCRVTDNELDVVITHGKMVHEDVVTMHFGLTNGANLATIPFAELRANLLDRVPNILDIRIERRQPNRVTVDVVEREPLVRVASRRERNETGRVADANGVVFRFSSNTSLLPLVRESGDQATPPGKKLTGIAGAALRLVETAALPELSDLRILEVDTSNPDYLFVTLGNYDRAKIAWDHMLEDTRQARESLRRQLRHLASAIKSELTPRTTTWTATDWGAGGRIYASAPSTVVNQ